MLSHARHVFLDVLTIEEPPAATVGGKFAPQALNAARNFEALPPARPKNPPPGGRPVGVVPVPPPGAPGGAPAPGRLAGRVMPCCFRHAASFARPVLEAALAVVDAELLVLELLPHPATSVASATSTTAVCDARGVSFFIFMVLSDGSVTDRFLIRTTGSRPHSRPSRWTRWTAGAAAACRAGAGAACAGVADRGGRHLAVAVLEPADHDGVTGAQRVL